MTQSDQRQGHEQMSWLQQGCHPLCTAFWAHKNEVHIPVRFDPCQLTPPVKVNRAAYFGAAAALCHNLVLACFPVADKAVVVNLYATQKPV